MLVAGIDGGASVVALPVTSLDVTGAVIGCVGVLVSAGVSNSGADGIGVADDTDVAPENEMAHAFSAKSVVDEEPRGCALVL